ncbi:MerR family transcriptional regulator [Roseomonas mucosa]|uniref:hypothetical protein n=1 Tax=Roseomonas mucosa TaxID=207340 RepID=UPI001115990D|nr:hypothetical protein [Roseomonas mucosa]
MRDTVNPMNDFTPGQPVTFTLGAAAKAAGVSKPTLSKAISSGRLSAEKLEDGSFRIQAAELFRVYPPDSQATAKVDESATPKTDPLLAGEVDRLRERLAMLTEERERERRQLTDQIEDLRTRLDQEGEERRKLTAILTDQTRPPEKQPETPTQPEKPRRLLGLFRRG